MFENFVPKSFCREFVELRRHSNCLFLIMASVLGLKPMTDDWIMKENLDKYLEVCRFYGLHARVDTMSISLVDKEINCNIIGRNSITTTKAMGIPVNADVKGLVHLYLSKDRNLLTKGMWYPLIVKDRIIMQPRTDSLRFGHTLGYPDCCISFFRSYNNWFRYHFLYEIFKNSRRSFNLLCNPLSKDTPYAYIYHMPCSFECRATIRWVHEIRKEIQKREPEYVKLIDMHLRLPYLVFFERNIYAFNGRLKGDQITYTDVYAVDLTCAPADYTSLLREGNRISVKDQKVHVYRNSTLLHIIEGGLQNMVREVPFLISFR